MKKIVIGSFAATALLMFMAVRSMPEAWTVDTEGAVITWEAPEDGKKEKGTIGGLAAEIRFDPEDLAASQITASVESATLTTNSKQKTGHLLSAEKYVDSDQYPKMTFTSQSFEAQENGWIANGILNFKDKEVEVQVPFTYEGEGEQGKFNAEMWLHSKNDLGIKGCLGSAKKDDIEHNLKINISIPAEK